jgi:hypothetical protein
VRSRVAIIWPSTSPAPRSAATKLRSFSRNAQSLAAQQSSLSRHQPVNRGAPTDEVRQHLATTLRWKRPPDRNQQPYVRPRRGGRLQAREASGRATRYRGAPLRLLEHHEAGRRLPTLRQSPHSWPSTRATRCRKDSTVNLKEIDLSRLLCEPARRGPRHFAGAISTQLHARGRLQPRADRRLRARHAKGIGRFRLTPWGSSQSLS